MHPLFLHIGNFAVRYYSMMIIMGVVAGVLFAQREARHRGWDPDMVIDFALFGVIGGIIGARAYYVIFQWPQYAANPLEIFKIWHGGLAIHGGWIAGLIVLIVFTRLKRLPFWEFGDMMSSLLLLGQAFGRIGNLMNGDAHGIPTLMPWGIRFPQNTAAYYDANIPKDAVFRDYTVPLHPTMIYENIWNLTGFLVLWATRHKPWPTGTHFGLVLIWTGIGRAVIESFRGDSLMLGNVKMAQVIGVIYVLVGIGIILYRREQARLHPESTTQSRALVAAVATAEGPGPVSAGEPNESVAPPVWQREEPALPEAPGEAFPPAAPDPPH